MDESQEKWRHGLDAELEDGANSEVAHQEVVHDFELELRAGLRLLPAPNGFADRVIARSRELPPVGTPSFAVRRPGFHSMLRWSLAAVLLMAVAVGAFTAHQRQRRIAGERARDQVLLALRITSITIRAMRDQADSDNHNNRQQQETP